MAALEKVMQMKEQGMSENEIIQNLKNEGVSPKEINDAISQSKIKQAVSREDSEEEGMEPSMMGEKLSEYKGKGGHESSSEDYVPQPPAPSGNRGNLKDEYQPQTPSPQDYQNLNQSQYAQQYIQGPSGEGEEYYPQEQDYGEDYGGYGDDQYNQAENADTSIEIAEQVFTEKIKKFQNQMEDLNEFKTLFKTKVENIEERLKRIEKMFDQMQVSIIEKVGAYGKGLDSLKKEMEMVEDSFSKVVNKATKTHSRKSKK